MILPARLSLIIVTLNGYIFSKWCLREPEILFGLLLLGSFIPCEAILLPLAGFVQWTDLFGTLLGLVLTHVVHEVSVTALILRNYYVTLALSWKWQR